MLYNEKCLSFNHGFGAELTFIHTSTLRDYKSSTHYILLKSSFFLNPAGVFIISERVDEAGFVGPGDTNKRT